MLQRLCQLLHTVKSRIYYLKDKKNGKKPMLKFGEFSSESLAGTKFDKWTAGDGPLRNLLHLLQSSLYPNLHSGVGFKKEGALLLCLSY